MQYRDSTQKLAAYREQIAELRRKMREVQAAVEPEQVADYVFATPSGSRSLSDLFGDKRDLFVIHNMGTSCAYCTLWADGFNGLYPHIADRAAFVVASPDLPNVQQRFAAGRGWRFPMVSHQGTTLPPTWDIGRRAAVGCRASRHSSVTVRVSCGSPTRDCTRATISARCGTCSTCCRRERRGGGQSSAMRDRG